MAARVATCMPGACHGTSLPVHEAGHVIVSSDGGDWCYHDAATKVAAQAGSPISTASAFCMSCLDVQLANITFSACQFQYVN